MQNHVDVHVGQRLKALREERGFSAEELAVLLDVKASDIQAMESGRRIEAEMLFRICQHLEVRPAHFYVGLNDDDLPAGPPGFKRLRPLGEEPA